MPSRSAPRFRGISSPLLALLALLLCGAGGAAPTAGPRLTDGLSLERDLRGGETHLYPVEIQAGQFLRVIVQEDGVDAVVRLLDPAGAEVTGVDGIVVGRSDEDLAAVAGLSGLYQVEIRVPKPQAPPGRYRLRVEGPRPARKEDAIRAEAVKAVRDGSIRQGRDEEALHRQIGSLERALPLWERLGERRRMAEVRTLLGIFRSQLPEVEPAIEDFRQCAALWGEQPDRAAKSWQAVCLNYAGKFLKQLERPDEARGRYEEALAITRGAGDAAGQALSLTNLATLDVDQGETQRGIAAFLEALQKAREARSPSAQADILNNLGYAYDQLAERQKALQSYRQVLELARSSANRRTEAMALNNLGETYSSLGEWETARRYYRQALDVDRALDDRPRQAKTLINLGIIFLRMGRLGEARAPFLQALTLGRTIKDVEVQALALTHQALLLVKLKQPAQGLEPARLAARLAQGSRDLEARAFYALGIAHRESGEVKAARTELARALSLAQELKDRASEAEYALALARAEQDDGEPAAALSRVRSAIAIIESFRTKVRDPALRASFLATKQDFYELCIDALMSTPSPGRREADALAAEALQVSEQARARSLLDVLTESGADVRKGADPVLAEREHRLRGELNALDSRRFELLSEEKPDRKRLGDTERRLEETLDEYRKAQADLRASSPGYAALTQPRPLSVAEIRGQVLDGRAMLLEYALGTKQSFLWAVSADAIERFELPGRKRIEPAARRYYELVTARNRQPREESPAARKRRIEAADAEAERAGQDLSRLLLAPARRLLGGRPLLVVADGALQYIPFAALPAPGSSAPLVARHEVVSLPSASALAALRREIRGRSRAPKALAIFADPVFQPWDPRLPHPARPAGQMKLAARTRGEMREEWSPEGERQDGGAQRSSFGRLPSSEREARTIAALVAPDQLFLARGFAASRAKATSPGLAQYRNVHFATHGVLDSRRPELSKLVLSLYDEQGKAQDGFLRLNDIYNLHLDADLVVLSACRTALGQEIRGEGLVGLTRGFMYAGAARVLASLWSVEDRATADLMGGFYHGMLREGLSPAAALRRAQLEMMKNPGRQSPFYWAGFSLQGEWR
jgi:CHAT domain-containing protein/Flp pilus assembly protein TadD